ncbi:hypothetical protein Taro_046733 [Colocasia esculenta]|uniref:Uncharacterized protein n=1 Tax=Colocasia esculenta TaxID=4460 RepID=A0A843X2V1_COLES|nr:hypothetical protein [Colocasia esculenta]
MHRSGSTTRASEEYFVVGMAAGAATPPSGAGKGATAGGQVRRSSSVGGLSESDDLLLPKYDPQSGIAKKDASRSRTGESAVHVIPLVLIACALVLWFFSGPIPRQTVVVCANRPVLGELRLGRVALMDDSGVPRWHAVVQFGPVRIGPRQTVCI